MSVGGRRIKDSNNPFFAAVAPEVARIEDALAVGFDEQGIGIEGTMVD